LLFYKTTEKAAQRLLKPLPPIKMKKYELTIFNQSRVIAIVFLLPVFLIGSLLLGLELMPKSYFWVVSIPMFVGLSGLMYYFAKADLIVDFNEENLIFNWKKKLIFNYPKIESIPIKEIKTIVVDQNQLLKKIITSDRVINISNGKLLMKDSQKFINLLVSIISQNGGRIIDSWDVWKEKGFLSIAYLINSFVLISVLLVVLGFIIIKGFDSRLLLFIPLSISQLFLYRRQMKEKLKKSGNKTYT
jgi:hypothetical protein